MKITSIIDAYSNKNGSQLRAGKFFIITTQVGKI